MSEVVRKRATAADQFDRVVRMVAELNRLDSTAPDGIALSEVARILDSTPSEVARDIRTLTLLGEEPDADWLLSLNVVQDGDRVSIRSGGAFQRPPRFTPEELHAIRTALASEPGAEGLAERIGRLAGRGAASREGESEDRPIAPEIAIESDGDQLLPTLELLRRAVSERRLVWIGYSGLDDQAPTDRVIEPHQVVRIDDVDYCVAWCRRADGWRHFRLERVLEATLHPETFERRRDHRPVRTLEDLFRHHDRDVEEVVVRFSPTIARWIRERHPDAYLEKDGSVRLTYHVASTEWLVRHLLRYGPEAEVIAPERYRNAMRLALRGMR